MLNLNRFMDDGIQNLLRIAGRFYLNDLKGQAFMLRMASALRKSARKRAAHKKGGVHVPPFLIASIASSCNLHCAGCYTRANGGCAPQGGNDEMSLQDWRRVFTQTDEVGVSFILLAGGEPLMRREVIELAAAFDRIIFPAFTNGTLIDENDLALFNRHRNLISVLSIEGDAEQTDQRRGPGVAQRVRDTAEAFKARGILYGVSITVTRENLRAVTEDRFISSLRENGCGLCFFAAYVPADKRTAHLVLDKDGIKVLNQNIAALRADRGPKGMILLSFPGDEAKMGSCLAAGRGFCHINHLGGCTLFANEGEAAAAVAALNHRLRKRRQADERI